MVTDGGIESLLADCANVLPAFAQSLGLKCSASFAAQPYLLPYTVYLPDWNHNSMNCVKRVLTNCDEWPGRLEKIRSLCHIYNNHEYRSCMQQSVMAVMDFPEGQRLEHFCASFAHWRYETVYTVFRALLPLREFSETKFELRMLGDCEDPASVQKFHDACKHKPLWRLCIDLAIK